MKNMLFLFFVLVTLLVACKKEKIQPANNSGGNTNSNTTPAANIPPVANAGADYRANRDTFSLDASASNDPDGSIVFYQWKKIDGPGNVVISGSTQQLASAIVSFMGMFQFELEVIDNKGAVDKDSIIVYFFMPGYLCDTLLRPVIDSRLNEFWRFPFERFGVGVTTLGTKVYFAGGRDAFTGNPVSHVAILDMQTKVESQSFLSIPRALIGCVSAGTKLFFAGGWTWAGALSRVEIVDVATGTSSTAELSEARWGITTAVLGNKVFFAGGFYFNAGNQVSSRIDIYDMITNTWSVATLSEARGDIAATVLNNKLYLAGGNLGYSVTSAIDIYDAATGSWSVSNLNNAVGGSTAIAAEEKIYYAGGYDITITPGGAPKKNPVCNVQIRNFDQSYSSASLVRKAFSMCAYRNNNKLIFYPADETSHSFFDVYDIVTNTWSIGLINNLLRGGVRFVYNGEMYVAGGYFGSTTFGPIIVNDKILRLEF